MLHDTSSRLGVSTEEAWTELQLRLDGGGPATPIRPTPARFPKRALLISVAAAVVIVGLIAAQEWRGAPAPPPRIVSPATVPQTQVPAHLPAPPDKILPDRIAVSGPDGNWVGYGDRSVLDGGPNFPAYPNDPEAAASAYLHELVPITKTEDPGSPLVGYLLRGYGFVDLASYNSPTFDLDALVAQGAAREQQEQERARAAGIIK